MKTLPVYRLSAPLQPSRDHIEDLAARLFSIEDYSLGEVNGRNLLRSKTQFIDVDNEKGAIWAADLAELWNPAAKPKLPDKQTANEIAEKFLRKNTLFTKAAREDRFVVEQLDVAGSYLSNFYVKTGKREDRQLDHRVRYGVRMVVEDPETGSNIHVPVVGGVGKLGVTIGDAGRVIAYNNSWRPPDTTEAQAAYIPREIADKQFKKLTSYLNVESFDADLAYAYAKSPEKLEYLYPVWAYRAMGSIKDQKFPLRIITVPATEFGPQPQPSVRQPKRSKRDIPLNKGITTKKRGMPAINPYEAGASWIGELGGLSGSRKNAQGFIDGLKDAGWIINFNWGNCDAWETDWHENDDDYVDAADFVFYTGHANENGWMLVNPGDCKGDDITYLETGDGDRWGQQDLEWVIVAACGPLEDDVISTGGGDVFKRWTKAFQGLHILMGYGAVTADNEDEGRKVVQYAREGQTLINAWFRTAIEIQDSTNGYGAPYGPTIYAAAMWAYKNGQPSPEFDHLWGCGSVASDPTQPADFSCMWVPC